MKRMEERSAREEDPSFPDTEYPSDRETSSANEDTELQLTYARMREKMRRMENPTNLT